MNRQLQLYGSGILGRRSDELDEDTDRQFLEELLEDMLRILSEEEGLGLAAPQAGESIRLFVLDSENLPSLQGHTVYINPVVSFSGETVRFEEGCLSLPGIYEDIPRSDNVSIAALDENMEQFSVELTGIAARAVQHELDHLDGVLIIDRLSPIRRRLLRGKLREISEEAKKRGQT